MRFKLPFLKEKPPAATLKTVLQAARYPDGRIDMVIEAVPAGETEAMRLPYTHDPKHPDTLTPQIGKWFKAHPGFKLGAMSTEVSAAEVKLEAARRIRALIPRFQIERELTGGKAVPASAKKAAQAVRDASNRIEKLNPIPADFREDRYWT